AAVRDPLAAALAPDASVQALLLDAVGPSFCAGYDLGQLGADAEADRFPDARIQEVLALLEAHPAPSVGVVQGPAFGAGCELACACDFRLGAPEASLCMPPVRLGVVYAPDGVWRAGPRAGPRAGGAGRWSPAPRGLGAGGARAGGLLARVPPDAGGQAGALAAERAAGAPLAMAGLRRTFQLLGRAPLDASARAELEDLRRRAFASADAREARAALREKRPPRWKGR